MISLPHQRKLQQQRSLQRREIVVRHQCDDGLALRVAVHGDAFLLKAREAELSERCQRLRRDVIKARSEAAA